MAKDYFKRKDKIIFRCHIIWCVIGVTVFFAISAYFAVNLLVETTSILKSYPKCDPEIVARDVYEYKFSAFIKRYKKNYSNNEEYNRKFEIFKETVKEAEKLNRYPKQSAVYGITKFSDMTKEEFRKEMMMDPAEYIKSEHREFHQSCPMLQTVAIDKSERFELKFDWRNIRGVVGPVLDQGQCGSCWAHSVMGVMESMMKISNQTDHYSRLSIEELLDCSNFTAGCKGGSIVNALQFLCDYHLPIVPEEEYPLQNKQQPCQLKSWPKSGVVLTKYMIGDEMTPMDLAKLILTHGPLVTKVNAYPWINYLGGIIQYHCSNDDLYHVVQIVGYDFTGPVPYFILRNSWGTDFGDNGYVYTAALPGQFICGVGMQIAAIDVAFIKT